MPSVEKNLSGSLTPTDEQKRRAVNRGLKNLGKGEKGTMRLPELQAANKLVGSLFDLYREKGEYDHLEMEFSLADHEIADKPVDLATGLAFEEQIWIRRPGYSGPGCHVVRVEKLGSGNVSHPSPDFHMLAGSTFSVEEGTKVVYLASDENNFQYLMKNEDCLVTTKDNKDGVTAILRAVAVNGKVSYLVEKANVGLVLVENGNETRLKYQYSANRIKEFYDVGGKTLIEGVNDSGNEVFWYDGSSFKFSLYRDRGPFFQYKGSLACYAIKKSTGNYVLEHKGMYTDDPMEHASRKILFTRVLNKKITVMSVDELHNTNIYYGNECLTDWFPHEGPNMIAPVAFGKKLIFAAKGSARESWSLFNDKREFVETDFVQIFSVRPLDHNHVLVFGIIDNKYVKKVFNLKDSWRPAVEL